MSQDTVEVGVVGLGYWGPNLARNFNDITSANLRWCCDSDPEKCERWSEAFPDTRFSSDLGELLGDPALDAVVVATDVSSHAVLVKQVVDAGKHCFVEKPLTQTSADAKSAVDAAEASGVKLMVGHLLQYHPGVTKVKELVENGDLGDIYYVYSNRLNLGKLRGDENALWSLGAHDVSVLLHLLKEEPVEVSAVGHAYLQEAIEDVVFCNMRFDSGVGAHLHLSWLDPHKARRFTVVGSKKMAIFDDMELERKVVVYDKGFDRDFTSYGEYITRSGDIWSPKIANDEPLKLECEHFITCIRDDTQPLSDGESGLRVVRVLEGLQRSLESDGSPCRLQEDKVDSR